MTRQSSDPDGLADLVRAVGDLDEAAFRQLYQATYATVLGVASRVLRSPEHSDEVVQEVYLAVWQRSRSYDPSRGSVLGWLTVMTHHRAVDRVRHTERSLQRELRSFDGGERVEDDVAVIALARLEASRVRAALSRLPGRQRDAVALTLLLGYSHEQAARLLQVPVGTLKTRLYAAIAVLREAS